MPTRAEIKASVSSGDGTEISYWTSGDGPPIVLVHGAPADHTRWRPLLPYLEQHLTVHAIDRRGRGASGDAGEYSLEREYRMLQVWWMPSPWGPGNTWTSTAIRMGASWHSAPQP